MTNARDAIAALFAPRAVAVIGASREMKSRSGRLIENLRREFKGPIYPINPKADEIGGLKSYPSVSAIPDRVDVGVIMLPAAQFLGALDDCAAAGLRAVVSVSGIPGDPAPVTAKVKEIVARTGLRLVGPNCLGLFEVNNGIALTYNTVEAKEPGSIGEVAIIGQSGGVLTTIWAECKELGVRPSHMVSTGNESDLTFEDFIEYLLEDPNVRTICCYIEAIRNPAKLIEVSQRAKALGKSIVALKVGHSEVAQRAAMSHTGAIVGSIQHADAFLDRLGITRVEGMTDSGAIASILRAPLPIADGVGVLTTTGGMSAGLADLCARYGLDLPPLSEQTKKTMYDLLAPINIIGPNIENPVDLGAPGVESIELWSTCLRSMLAEERIGVILATLGGGQNERAKIGAQIAAEAGKPFVLYNFARRPGVSGTGFNDVPTPSYANDSQAVRSISALLRLARLRREDAPAPAGPSLAMKADGPTTTLGEKKAKEWLAGYGIRFPHSATSASDDEILAVASRIGYPLVLKVDDPRILHKSDIGGVKVGIRDEASLRAAIAEVRANAAAAGFADLAGLLIEQQVEHAGIEWLVGLKNDAEFGPAVAFGVGGVLTEAVRDVALEPVPLDRARAEALMDRVAAARVLREGRFRGRAIDRGALATMLVAVSDLAVKTRGRIIELDLNPVVTIPDDGAMALDARALLAGEQ
jgi:acyl-CoA synthetase (NDP forming)